jgi:hypothetical protein
MDEAGRGGVNSNTVYRAATKIDGLSAMRTKSANALSPGRHFDACSAQCRLAVEPQNSLLQRVFHSCDGPRCGHLSYCFKIINGLPQAGQIMKNSIHLQRYGSSVISRVPQRNRFCSIFQLSGNPPFGGGDNSAFETISNGNLHLLPNRTDRTPL